MGNVVGSISSGFVDVVGKLLGHPLDFLAGKSCDTVCGPTWDLSCYIENFCIAHLAKLLLVSLLFYLVLVFLYLLKKLGVFHCIYHVIYKLVNSCFSTCFYGLECCCTSLCSILDRHNRRRRGERDTDIELAVSDGEESEGRSSYRRRDGHVKRRRRRRRRRGSEQEYLSKSLGPRSHRTHVEVARKSKHSTEGTGIQDCDDHAIEIATKSKHSKEGDGVQDCDYHGISKSHHVRVSRTSKFANKKQPLKHSSISRLHRRRYSSHL